MKTEEAHVTSDKSFGIHSLRMSAWRRLQTPVSPTSSFHKCRATKEPIFPECCPHARPCAKDFHVIFF